MIPINEFAAFLAASVLLVIIPGPAVLYITTRTVSQGRTAGMVSVAGIATGSLVHVLGAAIGVSAVIARSAVAMQYVRWIGAGYLIYLGIQKLYETSRGNGADAVIATRRSLWDIYKDGVIVNVFNPKTALFFLAFLPQFVDIHRGSPIAQLLLLGICFIVVAVISDFAYVFAAAAVASAAKRSPRLTQIGSYASGVVYIGLGIATAAHGRSK